MGDIDKGVRKMMDDKACRPVEALRTFWLTVWLVWLFVGLLLGAVPALLQTMFGLQIQGILPSVITIAALLVIMLPIGVWLPAYYRSIEYRIDSESVRSRRGVFWKRITTVPFHKITNVDITQGPLQRAFGIGTIHVQTAGAGGSQGGQAELLLQGIDDLEGLRDRLLARSLEGGNDRRGEESDEALGTSPVLEELSRIRRLLEDFRK
jgi:membrane protein YdbS with pleckstrin-like domain